MPGAGDGERAVPGDGERAVAGAGGAERTVADLAADLLAVEASRSAFPTERPTPSIGSPAVGTGPSSPGLGAVLEIRSLDAAYGNQQVLFGVDLDVGRGEALALLGTNGAGKTTLLRTISGLHRARRGVVRFQGRDLSTTDAATRVQLGIVGVPGGRATFPSLSVLDNLLVGCHLFAWDGDRVRRRIAAVLEVFGRLGERLDQPAGTLSGGEQQMLALAKALLPEPALLLIDELSLGLAPVVVEQLLEVVATLAAAGTTMIIVEQSINVALAIADRAVWLEKGRTRFVGATAELLDRHDLVKQVFLGGRS